jgi:hypothetical protein
MWWGVVILLILTVMVVVPTQVAVSAVTGEGVSDLTEQLMLQSEVMELRADRKADGEGVSAAAEPHHQQKLFDKHQLLGVHALRERPHKDLSSLNLNSCARLSSSLESQH